MGQLQGTLKNTFHNGSELDLINISHESMAEFVLRGQKQGGIRVNTLSLGVLKYHPSD